jgi:hypothetical protein
MAEIINFNKARKRRLLQEAGKQAAENRVRFGRTPAQKARDEAEAAQAQLKLELLKREPPT